VLRCVKGTFPTLTDFGGVHADPLPDHPSGRAVDIMIPNYRTAEGAAFGWQVARWLQANQQALGVQYVIFDAKIWNIARNQEGWRPYRPGYTNALNDSSLHRNHVHVTVSGSAGTGFQADDGAGSPSGGWVSPLAGGYVVGCAWHCYVNPRTGLAHTGQDFEVAIGTPVRASNAGTVQVSKDLAGSYGRYIVIRDHTDPAVSVYYAHLSARDVAVGDQVEAGQVIGRTGSSGNSTGPHCTTRSASTATRSTRSPCWPATESRHEPHHDCASRDRDLHRLRRRSRRRVDHGPHPPAQRWCRPGRRARPHHAQHRRPCSAGRVLGRRAFSGGDPPSRRQKNPVSCRSARSTPTTPAPARPCTARPRQPEDSGSPSPPASAARSLVPRAGVPLSGVRT
jgi:Peptidase family M23